MRVTVLGGGPGGYVAGLKAAQLGAMVTVIEASEVGGTCLNRGCIPTKALLSSAEVLHKARNLAGYGIELNGSVTPKLSKIMERKDKVVAVHVKGIRDLFKSWGITLIEGRGALLQAGRVNVEKRDGTNCIIDADRIIIATGSRPAQIEGFAFDGHKILSSDDALSLEEIPESMLIIGAGAIGCEFATIYNAFGTDIIIIEMQSRAVSTEDTEISEALEREFKKKKIRLITGSFVTRIEDRPDGLHSLTSTGEEIITEKILVSVGRKFNSDGIGLENTDVKKDYRGGILVNEKMETTSHGIYAAGDVTGGMLLAHVASAQGITAAENACGTETSIDYSVVPFVIFTFPEIASVGLREYEAVEKGIKTKIGRFQFRTLGKAHAMGEISGFVKFIADADTEKAIGAHIIGPHASDLIHEAALAIKAGLKLRDIAGIMHAHPTLSEALMEAAGNACGRAIHAPKMF